MHPSPLFPLVIAAGEHAAGVPVSLGWWAAGVTVALIAMVLIIPKLIRRRVQEEVDDAINRRFRR
ncbi:MAG TPA: hypothetical protein VJZ71_17640 [Phycisphaerae bacterium]|nr:hypothetical protein [Phycisphaerae bacterium]